VGESEDRPWEQPGVVRRDAELHRGGLLSWLARAPVFSGIFLPCVAVSIAEAYPPHSRDVACLTMPCLSGAGLLLSIVTLMMARDDLAKMQAGTMDPQGKAHTQEAKSWAIGGLLINLALIVLALLWAVERL
jgi:hypothetical protein